MITPGWGKGKRVNIVQVRPSTWTVDLCHAHRALHIYYSYTRPFRDQPKHRYRPNRTHACTSCTSCANEQIIEMNNVKYRIWVFSMGWIGKVELEPLTLHPPFFSMVEWHLVHSLVLAEIQLAVSLSSSHFCNQSLTMGHIHGWWSANEQPKQNLRNCDC